MLFYHRKPSARVQTRDWHSYGHRPRSLLGKPLSTLAYRFHGTSKFIEDFCTINDDGEFSSSYKYIYPKQLELKLEHQGEHATFLDLDTAIEDNIFE